MAKTGKMSNNYKRVTYLIVSGLVVASWVSINYDLNVGLKYLGLGVVSLAAYKYLT